MAKESKIQWTQSTWNPWHGCKKVSEGCKYCYMFRDKSRYGQDPTEVKVSLSNFNLPTRWNEPRIIFTCSWSDWFIEAADKWRGEAWEIIKNTPQHTYQILTKRPERIRECLPDDWGAGYPNVWLGVSVEDEPTTQRIGHLLHNPAKVRFISCEPLLSNIDLRNIVVGGQIYDCLEGFGDINPGPGTKIDWVIIGGESGNDTGKYKFRICETHWIENIINQCKDIGVPVFVKQLGTHIASRLKLKSRHGSELNEWPEQLKIRETLN